MQLDPGEGHQAVGVGIAIRVKEPILGVLTRDVLLEHDCRSIRPAPGERQQLLGRVDKQRIRDSRRAQSHPWLDVLENDREITAFGEGKNVFGRPREYRIGSVQPQLPAEVMESPLAGEFACQVGRNAWNQEIRQRVGKLGHEHCGLVVGRDHDSAPAKPAPQRNESIEQGLPVLGTRSWPYEASAQVPGHGRRREAVLCDCIDGHAHAAERADCPDDAVLKGIPADLGEEGGNGPIELDR
jgi:hypothetical protein